MAKPRRWDHHWEGTDECWWSVASVVALVAVTKGLILGYRADFAPKVQCLCCGGSSYIGLWHTAHTHIVIVMVNGGFALWGV